MTTQHPDSSPTHFCDQVIDEGTDAFIDRESVYDDMIQPLMKQISQLCQANGVSFVARFQLTDGFRGAEQPRQILYADWAQSTPWQSEQMDDLMDVTIGSHRYPVVVTPTTGPN